jgi:hypothetical protein
MASNVTEYSAVAVDNIIVVVRHGDVAQLELLLCFDCRIMRIDKLFQKALQGTFVRIRRLDSILQVGQTGFTSPSMRVVKIAAVIQRSTFKYDLIILFADNGRSHWLNGVNIWMIMGSR